MSMGDKEPFVCIVCDGIAIVRENGKGGLIEDELTSETLRIANEEELEKRMSLEHHRIVQKALKEEGLMRAPLKYQRLDEVGSFTR